MMSAMKRRNLYSKLELPLVIWQKIHDATACPRDRAALRIVFDRSLVMTAVDEQLQNLFQQLSVVQIGMHKNAEIVVPGTNVKFLPFAYAYNDQDSVQRLMINMTLRDIPSMKCALAYIDLCEQLARLCGRETVQACFYFGYDEEEDILKQVGVGIRYEPRPLSQGSSEDLCLQIIPYTPLSSWRAIWDFAKDKTVQYNDGEEHYPFRITSKLYDTMRSPLIIRQKVTRAYFGKRLRDADYELLSTGTSNYKTYSNYIVSFAENDWANEQIYQSPTLDRHSVRLSAHYNDELAMDGIMLSFKEVAKETHSH